MSGQSPHLVRVTTNKGIIKWTGLIDEFGQFVAFELTPESVGDVRRHLSARRMPTHSLQDVRRDGPRGPLIAGLGRHNVDPTANLIGYRAGPVFPSLS
ncbi:hypothetical protein MLP_21430 [Microlunatus phosphovorus NM-1]|uniref:Uncharacterized protein n=1 Tax=Microlunatus phosphovorus (strain ATCC 700054 / DSM 10555 / JCM 9379 / NBRC 101784 / NCIMB 13414 / VKM Ac-1990 / NM-1) TaxID=1032480 RepID=F5XDY4_MICPN|nr:hypothetical protein MLP_21430 [Microlunatus phosphovorus NM-1]